MSAKCAEVVITAPGGHRLAGRSTAPVREPLVTRGHHTPAVRSIHRWPGAPGDPIEAEVAADTRAVLVPELVEDVGTEHPYEMACVVALAITGRSAHLRWVVDQIREAAAWPAGWASR